MSTVKTDNKPDILMEEMREAGAHYGYAKARKHPSTDKYIFGAKNNTEIFDLGKTAEAFNKALMFTKELGSEGKTILFVGTKNEARRIVRDAAESVEAPCVFRRWIGGTLTNWSEIKGRVETLKDMRSKRESGEYKEKYTKKEQLLKDREIESLEDNFGGIVEMEKKPDALFVIDPKHESIAVAEARAIGIPVIALANNDCDLTPVDYPIPGNDSIVKSISYFTSKIAKAYMEGLSSRSNKASD